MCLYVLICICECILWNRKGAQEVGGRELVVQQMIECDERIERGQCQEGREEAGRSGEQAAAGSAAEKGSEWKIRHSRKMLELYHLPQIVNEGFVKHFIKKIRGQEQ